MDISEKSCWPFGSGEAPWGLTEARCVPASPRDMKVSSPRSQAKCLDSFASAPARPEPDLPLLTYRAGKGGDRSLAREPGRRPGRAEAERSAAKRGRPPAHRLQPQASRWAVGCSSTLRSEQTPRGLTVHLKLQYSLFWLKPEMSLSLNISAWWLCVNSLLNIVFGSFSINHHDNPIHRQNRSQISRQAAVNQRITCSLWEM